MKGSLYYKLLLTSYSLSTFSEGVLIPIYAVFVQKVGGSILDAAGAVATFFIVSGVAEILIHRTKWSRFNRRKLMLWGWLIWLLGIVSYLFISNILTLFIAQVLTALGNAIADPAYDAELSEHTDETLREYQYGMYEGAQDIFQGIAAITGGLIAYTYGFTILIVVMIITATLSFLLIMQYLRQLKPENLKSASPL